MGDLTKNISRHEIECPCGCGLDTIDYETVEIIQEACDLYAHQKRLDKVVLHITSGVRCAAYNATIKDSSPNSQHIKCRAIDHYIEDVSPTELYKHYNVMYPNQYGIGLYSTFVHFDTRSEKARW